MLELLLMRFSGPLHAVGSFIEVGDWVLPWIFLAGLIMWTLIVERWWYFRFTYLRDRAELVRQWSARQEHQSWHAHQIRRMLISRANARMTANLPLLRVLVPLCPLLGLLGTVSGMLEVFDAMALQGYADMRRMSDGVSQAMVATLAGLTVSLSGIFFVGRFHAKSRVETELLADALKY